MIKQNDGRLPLRYKDLRDLPVHSFSEGDTSTWIFGRKRVKLYRADDEGVYLLFKEGGKDHYIRLPTESILSAGKEKNKNRVLLRVQDGSSFILYIKKRKD